MDLRGGNVEIQGRPFPSVIIVGAGISGLCLAIRLKQAGFDQITILESSDDVGGTWLKNSYPNAGCDVPSYLYSYSFARKFDWTMKYARQPEILSYLRQCGERFAIRSHIRFNTAVESAAFDESSGTWRITTQSGESLVADIFVSAVGQLNRPQLPKIEGMERFRGEQWHSARWNHEFDFSEKTVAVIGNGASAIQFLPEIASRARKIYHVQRTPCWVQSFNNYLYPAWARWALSSLPFCVSVHRLWIYLSCEWRIFAFREGGVLNKEYARWLRRQMRRKVPADQWSKLIPEYSPGCKRILLSNDYLETLARANVDVITEPLERLDAGGIVTRSATHHVDAVIFATGFKATEFLQPMQIRGRDGRLLEDVWSGRPKAYYGMAAPGFPNMFLLYGPNTNLGHNSIIFMVERQVESIVRCLRRLRKSGSKLAEVNQQAMDEFDRDVQQRLRASVWSGDCTNWYKSKDGTIPNNWWGSATAFWFRLWRRSVSDFQFMDK
jgi:cation diffusion facilitator CzcD-associated flavoprotein CzcO